MIFRGAVEKTSLSAVDTVELARAYQPKTGGYYNYIIITVFALVFFGTVWTMVLMTKL